MLTATALDGLPEVQPGDDLAELIIAGLRDPLRDGDVLVIAHKIVSKAEGRIRRLADVTPSDEAVALAERVGKDPRHVQVVLDGTQEVLRATHGVLICVTHHGFVCANAGVDASNVAGEDTVVMLPVDPDASARAIRSALRKRAGVAPAIVITDSFGRAWRHGQVDITIGCAGARAARGLARPRRFERTRAARHVDRGRRRARGGGRPRAREGRISPRRARPRCRSPRDRRRRTRRAGVVASPGGGPVQVASRPAARRAPTQRR